MTGPLDDDAWPPHYAHRACAGRVNSNHHAAEVWKRHRLASLVDHRPRPQRAGQVLDQLRVDLLPPNTRAFERLDDLAAL
jgi:hypothetical protein